LFDPVNSRIPKIRLKTSQYNRLLNQRIVVAIDDWTCSSRYPVGHYLRSLGPIGDREVETQVLLLEHDIPPNVFSKEVLDCLPPADWKITEENSRGRVDLRENCCIVSIDPPGCKDIDDALHARDLPNGHIEVGIHIADVSYYIKHDSPLDQEARNRSTSTYLVDRRLDMLPKLLTENLCSLVGGEDRFAFSVIVEMNDEAEVLNQRFVKTIIRSRKAMRLH
jgi:singapore isolate B (sub-type 7) whole genome shotgun sequence assembly, scaffold_0